MVAAGVEGLALEGVVAESVAEMERRATTCLAGDHVCWGRGGEGLYFAQELSGRGWRIGMSSASNKAVVSFSGAEGEGGRNVEIRGMAMHCSWSPRSDGVEFYMAAALGSTRLGCLAGWSLQIAPSATSVRQRSSVRPSRGAASGGLAPPRPQRTRGPIWRGLGQPVLHWLSLS